MTSERFVAIIVKLSQGHVYDYCTFYSVPPPMRRSTLSPIPFWVLSACQWGFPKKSRWDPYLSQDDQPFEIAT
jgi:hypothetical protein